ncbi:hypothetical protein RRG08_054289 [Elysia crispata]|uniref:Cystatin domain-containing protein n=1 Tax=Elysia crispata TaxID=231223 RepID=A0AAE0XUA6_9GAST|nr:hypothetical protein RRG08_054289 [Elysia crispata]
MRLKIELCALFGFTVLLKLVTPDSAAKGPQKVVLAHDDPIVKFAVGAINKFYFPRDRPQMTLIKVVKAEKMIVSGELYFLILRLEYWKQRANCRVRIWLPPSSSVKRMKGVPECDLRGIHKDVRTRAIPGQYITRSVYDEDVVKALRFAVTMYNKRTRCLYLTKPVNMKKVRSKIVSGVLYDFQSVQLAGTDCSRKNKNVDVLSCSLRYPMHSSHCDFTVWSESWKTENYKMVENFKCGTRNPCAPVVGTSFVINKNGRYISITKDLHSLKPRPVIKEHRADHL